MGEESDDQIREWLSDLMGEESDDKIEWENRVTIRFNGRGELRPDLMGEESDCQIEW